MHQVVPLSSWFPNSAVIADPALPVTINPVNTGPNSRVSDKQPWGPIKSWLQIVLNPAL